MKKFPPLLMLAASLICSTAAQAKPGKDVKTTGTYGCARFDVNENGILDPSEIEALKKAFAEGDTALKLLDTNNNGILDDSEIAAIKLPDKGQGKGKEKKEGKKKKDKDAEPATPTPASPTSPATPSPSAPAPAK